MLVIYVAAAAAATIDRERIRSRTYSIYSYMHTIEREHILEGLRRISCWCRNRIDNCGGVRREALTHTVGGTFNVPGVEVCTGASTG